MRPLFEVIAAKQKKDAGALPVQQPMRVGKNVLRNPTTDQKKVRRQLSKKAVSEAEVTEMVRRGTPWESDCPNPFCRDGVHGECSGAGCDCPCHAFGVNEMGFTGSRENAFEEGLEAIEAETDPQVLLNMIDQNATIRGMIGNDTVTREKLDAQDAAARDRLALIWHSAHVLAINAETDIRPLHSRAAAHHLALDL